MSVIKLSCVSVCVLCVCTYCVFMCIMTAEDKMWQNFYMHQIQAIACKSQKQHIHFNITEFSDGKKRGI